MSTDLLVPAAPAAAPATPPAPPKRKKKRRRRRFSLNGLAIQLSAFALSFTLVALLVVSGSQQAFVEENEAVTNYVPIGTTVPPGGDDEPYRASRPTAPSPSTSSVSATTLPAQEPEPDETVVAVELTDSDAGTAMFIEGDPLAPGDAEQRCIEVTYAGHGDPRPVRLYAAGIDGPLAPYLDLTIDIGRGSAGAFGSCAGFVPTSTVYAGTMAGFAMAHGNYASGAATWDPSAQRESRHFRFSVAVQDDPAAAGRSATFGFSWETREDA